MKGREGGKEASRLPPNGLGSTSERRFGADPRKRRGRNAQLFSVRGGGKGKALLGSFRVGQRGRLAVPDGRKKKVVEWTPSTGRGRKSGTSRRAERRKGLFERRSSHDDHRLGEGRANSLIIIAEIGRKGGVSFFQGDHKRKEVP